SKIIRIAFIRLMLFKLSINRQGVARCRGAPAVCYAPIGHGPAGCRGTWSCVARQIAGLRASEDVQARFDELADKNTAGTLSPEEHAEYESLVAGATFIAILQAKARALPADSGRQDEAGTTNPHPPACR